MLEQNLRSKIFATQHWLNKTDLIGPYRDNTHTNSHTTSGYSSLYKTQQIIIMKMSLLTIPHTSHICVSEGKNSFNIYHLLSVHHSSHWPHSYCIPLLISHPAPSDQKLHFIPRIPIPFPQVEVIIAISIFDILVLFFHVPLFPNFSIIATKI